MGMKTCKDPLCSFHPKQSELCIHIVGLIKAQETVLQNFLYCVYSIYVAPWGQVSFVCVYIYNEKYIILMYEIHIFFM